MREVKVVRRDEKNQEVREVMEVKEILPQRKEMKTVKERGETSTVTLAGSQTSSEGQSSSSAGPSSLNLCSLTASGLTEAGLVAKALSLSQQSECYSEIGGPSSLIQDTQPPSMMQDSMPSLTLGQSLQGPNEAPVQGPEGPLCPLHLFNAGTHSLQLKLHFIIGCILHLGSQQLECDDAALLSWIGVLPL